MSTALSNLVTRLSALERRVADLEHGSTTMRIGPSREDRRVTTRRMTAKDRTAMSKLARKLGVTLPAKNAGVQ